MKEVARSFEDIPAARKQMPVTMGLVGPSGSGKTFSALRLATGIQRVTGGEIMMIDTESNRGLHYAENFKFRHVAFGAPFSPLDYLAALQHCEKKGAKIVIVDSMSHEHESVGGVLEMHEAALDRMAGSDFKKRQALTFAAWAEPKAQRRRLINTFMQMDMNFIFCFRAKQKLRIPKKGDEDREIRSRGWQPIAGEEFIYEMMVKCLLLPGADGRPTWQPEEEDERSMVKLPEQFRALFASSPQLSEDIGQKLAEWAKGAPAVDIASMLARYDACDKGDMLRELETERGKAWARLSAEQKRQLRAAADMATERLKAQAAA